MKRTLQTPKTPSSKRTKTKADQHTLESFFSPSSRSSPKKNSSQRPNVATFNKGDAKGASFTEIIDVDAELNSGKRQTQLDLPASPKPIGGPSGLITGIGTSGSSIPHSYQSLSQDPLKFNLIQSPWLENTPAPYSFLAHTLTSLSETRSRIAIINILTNCLRILSRFHPDSLLPSLYLLSNTLTPSYVPIELGLGPSILSKAIQQVSGITPQALKRLYNKTGDPGDVAYEAKSNLRTLIPHSPLVIPAVYQSLLKIARCKGSGAAKQKQAIVEKLLLAAKGEEVRFLTRTLCQNLRVGAVRTSILIALARAMVLTPPPSIVNRPPMSLYYVSPERLSTVKELDIGAKKRNEDDARRDVNLIFSTAEALIKKVYVQHPNYDGIVGALLEVGLDGLIERVPLTVGVPLHPMLGSPMRSLEEVYTRLGGSPFLAEFKYDGQRAQVHGWKSGSGQVRVRVFSRHLEDMTDKYPDVVQLVDFVFQASSSLNSFVIDSEITAINPLDGTVSSFQELSNRARKDVSLHDVKIPVAVFAFDIMYLNGESLLDRNLRKRKNILQLNLPPFTPIGDTAAQLRHVESCVSDSGKDVVEDFWETAVASRCEGLMVKLLDGTETQKESNSRRKPLPATYEPDKRTLAWLKLKKDYVKGLGDSLDLVPIGAWHGNGRKAQWWSPILLAIYDQNLGTLVAVCKCMSGFTDAFYKSLKERYPEDSDTCSSQPLWECVTGGLVPDFYFRPQEVWEIRGADITLSPVSVAALGSISPSRGLSLRFPRFIRVREDKDIEQASSEEFLVAMCREQHARGQKQDPAADDGEMIDVDVEEESEAEEMDFSD